VARIEKTEYINQLLSKNSNEAMVGSNLLKCKARNTSC